MLKYVSGLRDQSIQCEVSFKEAVQLLLTSKSFQKTGRCFSIQQYLHSVQVRVHVHSKQGIFRSIKILCLTLCPLGNFSCFFFGCLLFFFKINFTKNSFIDTLWVSRSGPNFFFAWSGSKLLAKVIGRRQGDKELMIVSFKQGCKFLF